MFVSRHVIFRETKFPFKDKGDVPSEFSKPMLPLVSPGMDEDNVFVHPSYRYDHMVVLDSIM